MKAQGFLSYWGHVPGLSPESTPLLDLKAMASLISKVLERRS